MCKFGGSSSRGEFGRESERAGRWPFAPTDRTGRIFARIQINADISIRNGEKGRNESRSHLAGGARLWRSLRVGELEPQEPRRAVDVPMLAEHKPRNRPLTRASMGCQGRRARFARREHSDFTLDNPCYTQGAGGSGCIQYNLALDMYAL